MLHSAVVQNCRHTTSGSGCTAVTISKGAAKWFPSTLGIDLLLLIEDTNKTANCLFTFHLQIFFFFYLNNFITELWLYFQLIMISLQTFHIVVL